MKRLILVISFGLRCAAPGPPWYKSLPPTPIIILSEPEIRAYEKEVAFKRYWEKIYSNHYAKLYYQNIYTSTCVCRDRSCKGDHGKV